MDVATTLVLVAVLLMLLVYVFRPFLAGAEFRAERVEAGPRDELRRRADLLAERNRVYGAIRALDFDHSTNKVVGEDYAAQRHALVAQGVDLLKRIDMLPAPDETPAADPVEAAVVALRSGGAARKGRARTSFCPGCGRPVVAGDRFCGSCGARL